MVCDRRTPALDQHHRLSVDLPERPDRTIDPAHQHTFRFPENSRDGRILDFGFWILDSYRHLQSAHFSIDSKSKIQNLKSKIRFIAVGSVSQRLWPST